MTIAVYGRHTLAGAKRIVFDEGINIAPHAKSSRERIIEMAARWNERHPTPGTPKPVPAKRQTKPRRRPTRLNLPTYLPEKDEVEALRILNERGMPTWARNIVISTAAARGVSALDVATACRSRIVVPVRNEVFYVLKTTPSPFNGRCSSHLRIATWFGRDHSGILYGVSRHADDHGLENPSNYNLADVSARKRARALEYKRAKRGLK